MKISTVKSNGITKIGAAGFLAIAILFSANANAQTADGRASFLEDPMQAPSQAFSEQSLVRSFIFEHIDRNIPGMGGFGDSAQEMAYAQYTTPQVSDADMLWLNGGSADAEMSLTERKRREKDAKDQVYRIFSNMLFSMKPIARLRAALEPYTRPLELYQGKNGDISPSYFGQEKDSKDEVKVFSLNIGVSSSHNINVMANIYSNFEISLLDGTRLIAQYMIPDSGHKVGFESKLGTELLLRYSMNF